jgi:hypothetical protein
VNDDSWSEENAEFQGAPGGTTQIAIPKNRDKAFFKILMITEMEEDEAEPANIP